MTSLMTSPGHKIGQILKLIYFRHYLNYNVDQKLKMSEMLMAIFLVYSTSGITSGKKVCRELKMAVILKILKYWTQLQFDLRYDKIVPNYAKNVFYGDDVIDDVTGWPQSFSLYSWLGEVGSGSKLKGQCLVNKCQYHNCLSRLYMPKDDLNELHFSRLQVKGLLDDLGTNKEHCKLSQIELFLDCDGIDNVTLRLWKFSDFCSRHIVGVAGDDIMFHILVITRVIITRVSEVIMFSPYVFVCVCGCLCLSRCLSGRFNYEGLVPHKQYFAGTLLGMSSCASYDSRTHDVIDDVTRSQSRSNFESDISPLIFELQRRSKAQNVGNAHGYLSGLFNFRYNFR